MLTAQSVYSSAVAPLPASERLRLATLILEGLAGSVTNEQDADDQWSEEDVRELAAFSRQGEAALAGLIHPK